MDDSNAQTAAAPNDILDRLTAVDPLALRNAMGSFLTGVTIVTTRNEAGSLMD